MVPECTMPRVLHHPADQKNRENFHVWTMSTGTLFSYWTNFSTGLVHARTTFVPGVLPFIPNFVRLTTLKLVSTKLDLLLGKLKNGPIYHIKFFYHSSPILLRVITTLVISYHNDQTSGTFSRENSVVRYVGKITTDFRPAGPSIFAGGPHTSEDPLGVYCPREVWYECTNFQKEVYESGLFIAWMLKDINIPYICTASSSFKPK